MAECDSCVSHQSTSNGNGERTTKVEKKRVSRKELIRRTKIDSLLEVYNDLATMKWIGADETWDNAIEAVRNDLFNRIRKSLKKSDRVEVEHPIINYYKDR